MSTGEMIKPKGGKDGGAAQSGRWEGEVNKKNDRAGGRGRANNERGEGRRGQGMNGEGS